MTAVIAAEMQAWDAYKACIHARLRGCSYNEIKPDAESAALFANWKAAREARFNAHWPRSKSQWDWKTMEMR